MFGFHLKMAMTSIRKTPWITLLCIAGIGLGVTVSTSLTALHYLSSKDPIPHKSDNIFNVRLDTWDPNTQFFDVAPGEPPKATTYRDMAALMASDIPVRETGVASARAYIFPQDEVNKPYQTLVRLCHADFFPMFEMPFKYGTGWRRTDDVNREAVTVLSEAANDKLFGGQDSVGKSVRIGTRIFRIVGVLDRYDATPMVYDPENNRTGPPREFFVPFDNVREADIGMRLSGNTDGWGNANTFIGDLVFTTAEFYWIQHWVELKPQDVASYRDYVDQYALAQKELGRHPRPLNNRVQPMMEWVANRHGSMNGVTRGMSVISLLFLAVCAINLMGLLLGKFLSRSSLIGIHRALGASRGSVFMQHILECELLGVVGGLIGILLSTVSIQGIAQLSPNVSAETAAQAFQLDATMVLFSIGLSLAAGLVAGLYPAWRACRVSPALQLKV